MTTTDRARAGASVVAIANLIRRGIPSMPPSEPSRIEPADLVTLLVDLRHAAAFQGVDFEHLDANAERWFEEELMVDAYDLSVGQADAAGGAELDRNAIRAERGRLIAERYRREQRLDSLASALVDLAADLAHAALAAGLDPQTIVEMGLEHHREEVESAGFE